LALAPISAFAHGIESLFFPAGILSAAIAIFVMSLICGFRFWIHPLVAIFAIAASAPLWFIPMKSFPDWFMASRFCFFAYGFVPSFVVSAILLRWLWRRAVPAD
jgi:hypothetical protein